MELTAVCCSYYLMTGPWNAFALWALEGRHITQPVWFCSCLCAHHTWETVRKAKMMTGWVLGTFTTPRHC